jgi:HK97 family phage prohead protease
MKSEDRRARADTLRGVREVRTFPSSGLELREANGSLNLVGWASVTEHVYPVGWFDEIIHQSAFSKTLSESPDVQLLVNHAGLPLARTLAATMTLSEDDRGLRVDASLNADDPDVKRLAPKVARGDIDQMSFGFRVVKQDWDYAEDQRDPDARDLRHITEINLDRGDVSIVNYGANDATSFQINDLPSHYPTPSRQRHEQDEALEPVAVERPLFDYYMAQLHLGRR